MDFSRILPINDDLPNSTVSSERTRCAIDGILNGNEYAYGLYDFKYKPASCSNERVQTSIEILSKLIEESRKTPTVSLAPFKYFQSTPVKPPRAKRTNECYPKALTEQNSDIAKNHNVCADEKRTPQVVRDIVFEKYGKPYRALLQKCNLLAAEKNSHKAIGKHVETRGSPGNQPMRQNETGRSTTNARSQGNDHCSESSQAQTSDYDEEEFLHTALGEHFEEYLFCPTVSIDTDDVSALLSSRSTLTLRKQPRKRKIKKSISSIFTGSYYEPAPFISNSYFLKKSGDVSTTPELVREPFRYSYVSYEDVTNLGFEIYSDEGKKTIKKHIFINETIIEQTEKMLNYGMRKSPNFIGSHAHLEGERILLVSKMRKQVLQNYLYRIPETTPEVSARVTLDDLKCILSLSKDSQLEHHHQSYYMCVLQHKTTVYSTRIATPNKSGCVNLGGFFIFENVSNTFSIKVRLYCVNIPKSNSKCLPLPFCKSSPRLPMMELLGEACIGMLNIRNKTFTFERSDSIHNKGHKFSVSIEPSMNWPETLKGFLTIGRQIMDRPPIWNRRWCILEDASLKYHNYPSDENFCSPIGTVYLNTCKASIRSDTSYLNQKTICLILDESNGYKKILLSPDTNKEYELWSKHMEIILTLLKEWNFVKK